MYNSGAFLYRHTRTKKKKTSEKRNQQLYCIVKILVKNPSQKLKGKGNHSGKSNQVYGLSHLSRSNYRVNTSNNVLFTDKYSVLHVIGTQGLILPKH